MEEEREPAEPAELQEKIVLFPHWQFQFHVAADIPSLHSFIQRTDRRFSFVLTHDAVITTHDVQKCSQAVLLEELDLELVSRRPADYPRLLLCKKWTLLPAGALVCGPCACPCMALGTQPRLIGGVGGSLAAVLGPWTCATCGVEMQQKAAKNTCSCTVHMLACLALAFDVQFGRSGQYTLLRPHGGVR